LVIFRYVALAELVWIVYPIEYAQKTCDHVDFFLKKRIACKEPQKGNDSLSLRRRNELIYDFNIKLTHTLAIVFYKIFRCLFLEGLKDLFIFFRDQAHHCVNSDIKFYVANGRLFGVFQESSQIFEDLIAYWEGKIFWFSF